MKIKLVIKLGLNELQVYNDSFWNRDKILLFTDKSTIFFNKTSLSIVIKLKKKKIIIYVKW